MPNIKLKLYKAFTLAELMVILAVMTVVIAAIAPIFTSKYNTLMSNEVWHEVNADDNRDIFADAPNHSMTQEVMIGLSPEDLQDIKRNYKPYAKLLIRSSDRVANGASTIVQKPIEFYTTSADGTLTKQGYLVAGKSNMMLAGGYDSLNTNAEGNTAFGHNALNLISSGTGNTAMGTSALSALTTGSSNTAIGRSAGSSITNQNGNVFIGYGAGATGSYNTIITNYLIAPPDNTNYTTAVGNSIRFDGNYNTVIGFNADGGGTGNTAIGFYAMYLDGKNNNTEYNTAIGSESCSNIGASSKYKTCIGRAAAINSTDSILTNDTPTVLIGRSVTRGGWNSPATVVVTSKSTNTADTPYSTENGRNYTTSLNNSAVIIYGNLIVRGQTYMYGRAPFPVITDKAHYNSTQPALMGYTLNDIGNSGDFRPLVGLDGSRPSLPLDLNGYQRQVYAGKENCICTYSNGMYGSGYTNPGIQSYEWSAFYGGEGVGTINSYNNIDSVVGYFWYPYFSTSENVELNRAHSMYPSSPTSSCCPILTQSTRRGSVTVTSDARLKNIKDKFSAGLAELEKLKIFNYTYKEDKSLTPQVGVIAQDLKTVFPNAVSKDENNYLKIRWDEMFYAVINAIKELNNKIVSITNKVENDLKRISKLKDENKNLEKKLMELTDEIEKLEKN